MVEYALLLSLVALALVGTIGGMAGQVGGRFNAISNTLASGGNDGGPIAPDPSNSGTVGNHGNNPQTGNNNAGNNNGNIGTDSSNNGAIDPSKTPLDKVTPEELDKLSPDAAKNPDKYKPWLGQEIELSYYYDKSPSGKNIILTSKAKLIGIGQDKLADSDQNAGFTFMTTSAFTSITNESGAGVDSSESSLPNTASEYDYSHSGLRAEIHHIYNNLVNQDLKQSIKAVSKKWAVFRKPDGTYDTTRPQGIGTSREMLFAPSMSELMGNPWEYGDIDKTVSINLDEGDQYMWFSEHHENLDFSFFQGDKTTLTSFWTRSNIKERYAVLYSYDKTNKVYHPVSQIRDSVHLFSFPVCFCI